MNVSINKSITMNRFIGLIIPKQCYDEIEINSILYTIVTVTYMRNQITVHCTEEPNNCTLYRGTKRL